MNNKRFIQKINADMKKKGTKGAFKRAAEKRGLTTNRFMLEILAQPEKYSKLERKRAILVKTFKKIRSNK
tara:strand:- start:324 stop:533 length:210 start_codon:yes stop_codon:yes gene_type:complete